MKKIALAFVALTILAPVLGIADTAPAAPSAEELLQQIFASPAPQLASTTCDPTCDELDGQWCDGKGTCYTETTCIPLGCFCVQNRFVCP